MWGTIRDATQRPSTEKPRHQVWKISLRDGRVLARDGEKKALVHISQSQIKTNYSIVHTNSQAGIIVLTFLLNMLLHKCCSWTPWSAEGISGHHHRPSYRWFGSPPGQTVHLEKQFLSQQNDSFNSISYPTNFCSHLNISSSL